MSDFQNISLSSSKLSAGYTNGKKKMIIVEGINLSLKKGTLTTMVGINGSGKSTLLRTLAGLQNPISGEVLLQKSPIKTIIEVIAFMGNENSNRGICASVSQKSINTAPPKTQAGISVQ